MLGKWRYKKSEVTLNNRDYTDYTGKPHLKKLLGLGMVLHALNPSTQEPDRYLWV